MTKQADLIAYLFEDQQHSLAGELAQWMEASPRFTAFVDTFRDKIRKKVRVLRDSNSALDLRSELEVAYGLLNDRRLAVAYEPYASAKRRGPDFAVTYRANLVFNIEVARVRVEESIIEGVDLSPKEGRILRILLDKLGQLQPGMPNLLVIHTRQEMAQTIALDRLMQAIKSRAEAKDPAFYSASRYSGPPDFFKDFLHLSGILLWTPAQLATERPLWVNKQARPPLDEKVLRLVARAG